MRANVFRFAPKNGHSSNAIGMSVSCHERTSGTLPNRSKTRSYGVRGHLAFWGEGVRLHGGRMRVKELAGKTVFVTGAASGIGLGIATAFAQAGAKVMLCDIEEAALSAALKQLRLTNVDVDGVKADVSLKAELVAAAEATTARYGKVHILVNNAGVDLHTFECAVCNHVLETLAAYDDPMKSKGLGHWLQGDLHPPK